MREINVDSWEHFQEEIASLRAQANQEQSETLGSSSGLLFRGQADSAWKLLTTLERQQAEAFTLVEYYRLISQAKPQVESFTGRNWDIPSFPEFGEWLAGRDQVMIGKSSAVEFLVYLRHHGFPSPLLDWTCSSYVAAYFAFACAPVADAISLYVFREYAGIGKTFGSKEPHIQTLGPYIRTHPRHFLQQCQYTYCLVLDEHWRYACHERVFERDRRSQDLLWKYNIPSKERLKVLRQLDEHNVNAFSLFGSDEGLMETISMREMHFRDQI